MAKVATVNGLPSNVDWDKYAKQLFMKGQVVKDARVLVVVYLPDEVSVATRPSPVEMTLGPIIAQGVEDVKNKLADLWKIASSQPMAAAA